MIKLLESRHIIFRVLTILILYSPSALLFHEEHIWALLYVI
uniref:Uncharacterized protein n=1 Tax=Arundo donax TaxID=35708 RepID=A0A0A8Z6X3_ARUDO